MILMEEKFDFFYICSILLRRVMENWLFFVDIFNFKDVNDVFVDDFGLWVNNG